MEVILGGLSSLLYGFADFLGGEGSRKVTAATVVVWAGVFSFPFLVVAGLLVGGDASGRDLLLGGFAGLGGGVGLVMLFAGLARGRAAVVAPMSAALGAVVPLTAGIIAGDRPGVVAWVGVILAIPAIVLSAWVSNAGGSVKAGLLYGLVAGLSFGAFATLIGLTSDDSGLLPLIPARAALVLIVIIIAMFGAWRVQPLKESPVAIIATNSVLDITANIALLYALRVGSFALGAVSASFYPAVTVILARTVNGEHLRARQIVGIVLTLVALSLIALG